MSRLTPAAMTLSTVTLSTVTLAATAVAIPGTTGPAAAACQEGVAFDLSNHTRVHLSVPGTKITFSKPGTHTVEIVRRAALKARYGTRDASDQAAILAAAKQNWPAVRKAVAVTKGHKETFRTGKGERVTVTYATRGDQVRWTKLDVDRDCSTTVLDSGIGRFPRRNLDWLFAVAIS